MVGRAKSILQKKQGISQAQEDALARAIQLYTEEQAKPKNNRRSLRKICNEVQTEWQKKWKEVTVSPDTVRRRLEGGRSHHEANTDKSAWFTNEEEESILKYCLDLAARGFPFNHKKLKLHADCLLKARLGDAFPETGVGKNWTDRFISRHSDQLGRYWSSSLDTARGRAVNKHTNQAWYSLLRTMIVEEKIDPDCIWAADETGFQPGGGLKDRVIGAAKQKLQHQQRDGNRENITVVVTICADGEDIPPSVIYKGQAFSTNWHQDNSLRAS